MMTLDRQTVDRQKVKTRRQVEEIWLAQRRLDALNNVRNFEFLPVEVDKNEHINYLKKRIKLQIFLKYDVIL
jgi:hypothetical protein